jgi:hypothetical protein
MKEKDLGEQKIIALLCAIVMCLTGGATWLVNFQGDHIGVGIFAIASIVFAAWAMTALKYIFFDSKIVELKDEIDTLLSLKASHGEFRELGNQFREICREHAEEMVLVSERFMNQSLQSGKIATLQAQFDAVNEHYGIEIEKVEAGYRVK